jgi:hypothetical protein
MTCRMRITLTIDRDVAASLERLRTGHDGSLEALINEALRRGIKDMNAHGGLIGPFRTCAVDLGRLQIGSVDSINGAIAIAEGESFK